MTCHQTLGNIIWSQLGPSLMTNQGNNLITLLILKNLCSLKLGQITPGIDLSPTHEACSSAVSRQSCTVTSQDRHRVGTVRRLTNYIFLLTDCLVS